MASLSCPPRIPFPLPSSLPPCRGSSMLAAKSIPSRSPSFLRSLRGPHPGAEAAAAGRKRYWGTAMREEKLAEMIEKKVAEAMAACDGEEAKDSDGCRVAWDEVEEVSSAMADLRRRLAVSSVDPLEPFCLQNPEADECRIYED